MSELFWPGDRRAGDHFTPESFLGAMLDVEAVWLDVVGAPVEPGALHALVEVQPPDELGRGTEAAGTPVLGLVAHLRAALGDAPAATWLHRGLTSQDVVDSALMVLLRAAVGDMRVELRRQAAALAGLAVAHRDTPMVARTLTQHAVPTTFGLKVAGWLTGVLDAEDDLAALGFPVQLGGAAGTLAALAELGVDADRARAALADGLDLDRSLPWHTQRRPVTRAGDALVSCTDAWARIAADVLVLSRPEVGELSEAGAGGSSTMPDKANPVLSVLVRRAALTMPPLAATLHAAAADQVDERGPGGWHAEWDTLRLLARRTLVAGSQTTDLVTGLEVHADRMAATLGAARPGVHAEQRMLAGLAGHEPTGDYLGAAGALVDAVLDRARTLAEEPS